MPRGFRLGLVSNANPSELTSWRDCALCGLFDVEILSCEVGAVKPEPAIFQACLDRIGLRAEDCFYVGDGGSDELIAAKALGFATVFISGIIVELWPDRISERLAFADHHIERVPDILTVVGA
jgi:putative hydrolase of the HAD superfamily